MKYRILVLFCGMTLSMTLSTFAGTSILTPNKNNDANKLFGEKRYQEALDAYLELYDPKNESSEIAYNIANAYQAMGDAEKAELFYEKALKAKNAETLSSTQFNAGLMDLKNQKIDTAVEKFISYLQDHPEDQDAKRNLELALQRLQEQEQQQKRKQDDQNKEDQEENKDQQDQQQSQPGKDQEQKDQENQDQQNQNQENQDQQSKENQDQKNQDQQKKDQQEQQQDSESDQQQSQQENEKDQKEKEKEKKEEKKAQENQSQNGKTEQSEQKSAEEKSESDQIKEQILNALKEQEAQQQKQFMKRKSSKGQRKSKDW